MDSRHSLLVILYKFAMFGNWLLGFTLHLFHLLSIVATPRADA